MFCFLGLPGGIFSLSCPSSVLAVDSLFLLIGTRHNDTILSGITTAVSLTIAANSTFLVPTRSREISPSVCRAIPSADIAARSCTREGKDESIGLAIDGSSPKRSKIFTTSCSWYSLSASHPVSGVSTLLGLAKLCPWSRAILHPPKLRILYERCIA